ncbi:MAG TPA: hypothetical protein VII75_11550 [Thermoanaerobaculia bacterium]
MVTLSMLWLPILLSAVFIFIASNILWMALPFWHRPDYKKHPDEKTIQDALASGKSGQYIVPCIDWNKTSAEEREAMGTRPMALILLRNPGEMSMGKALACWFLYPVVIAIFVGYLAGHTLQAGVHYLTVFRVVGTAAFLAYGFRSVPDAIWYGKPWVVTIKDMIDGLIYALLMAGTFGWLWPR